MGMFSAIGRWWGNRDRSIYRFHDGTRRRSIDPLVAYRATFSHPGFSWDTTMATLNATRIPGDEGHVARKLEMFAAAADCARAVFRIPPFEAGGLTERECAQLLLDFEFYVAEVKKNGSPQPTSPPSVEPTPVATKADSESGSTATALEPSPHSGPLQG